MLFLLFFWLLPDKGPLPLPSAVLAPFPEMGSEKIVNIKEITEQQTKMNSILKSFNWKLKKIQGQWERNVLKLRLHRQEQEMVYNQKVCTTRC